MTDYFALLDQPRQPWLDLESVKRAFHEKSRRAHPDAGGTEAAFAQLNEAYQVLQTPRRRLQHLLALADHSATTAGEPIASDIAALFPEVAMATQTAEAVRQKLVAASNPLSRSLLQADVSKSRERCNALLSLLARLHDSAEEELRTLSNGGPAEAAARVSELQRLYARFSYLSRWMGELKEKLAQLSAF